MLSLYALAILAVVPECLAAEPPPFAAIQLFTTRPSLSLPIEGYDATVAHLKPGTYVTFSDGSRFQVGREVGKGNTTRIFEIVGDPAHVLRIPISEFCMGKPCGSYVTRFIDGAAQLVNQGVPAVAIHQHLKGEFVVVDRVSAGSLKLTEFLNAVLLQPHAKLPISAAELTDRLEDFAKKTMGLAEIGDFHTEQLVFDLTTREWRLIDWTAAHVPFYATTSANWNVFTTTFRSIQLEMKTDNIRATSEAVDKLKALQKRIDESVASVRKGLLMRAIERRRIDDTEAKTCLLPVLKNIAR